MHPRTGRPHEAYVIFLGRRLDLPVPHRSTLATIRSLLPYLWPKGDRQAHVRVLMAAACLVLAKVATVYVPLVYSHAVDALSPKVRTRPSCRSR